MSRNGPLALAFHPAFVVFMAAPILIVCVLAFTPLGYLSLPASRLTALVPRHPRLSRVRARLRAEPRLAAMSSVITIMLSLPAALAIAAIACRPRGDHGTLHVAPDGPSRRARHRLPAFLWLWVFRHLSASSRAM